MVHTVLFPPPLPSSCFFLTVFVACIFPIPTRVFYSSLHFIKTGVMDSFAGNDVALKQSVMSAILFFFFWKKV
jgi:hypothetical protein